MRLHQIAVQRQRALIGQRRVGGLAGVLIRDPEIIPRLRVGGHQRRRRFQLLHRAGIIAVTQKFFALQQRARPGRPAAGQKNGERQQQKARMEMGTDSRRTGFHPPSSISFFLWPASLLVVASTP